MQTASPYSIHNQSPGDQGPNFNDPYLSAPSDPEEDAFKSTAIRLTPLPGEGSNHHSTPDASSSPSDVMSGWSARGVEEPLISPEEISYTMGSGEDFLSPHENTFRDFSARTPPTENDLLGGLGVALDSGLRWQQGSAASGEAVNGIPPSHRARKTPDLLTPDMTHNPSPSSNATAPNKFPSVTSAQLALHNALGSAQYQQQVTPPTKDTGSDSLNVHDPLGPDSVRGRSPIVKVESYSRGDSPGRDYYPSGRRVSQSSTHLSPGGANESSSDSSEDEDSPADLGPAIPRSLDGSWIPNATTGSAGIDPTSRDDAYIPSPNELEIWRQLRDKNADIQNWSKSVSAANSEAGDEPPEIRGRKDQRGNRPRAKSAGDPSIYQDYFNYKLQVNDLNIPGPGALLYESSNGDFSEPDSEMAESRSESPPVSVNQMGYNEEPSENIPFPTYQSPEDDEPLPSQFIRVRPWQDPVQNPSPQTTVTQPRTSNAAMVEFQRRARDIDTASRSATWGTRDLSEAFESMSFSDEKNKRRNSLRKFFPIKAANNLKRQLSQISLNQPGDGTAKDEDKESPQRKDSGSSYRRLSIGRSHQRSPSLSTHGAVIAIAGQMAAIGGRGSISGTPTGGTTPRITPRKIRQRSRSEVPKPSTPSLIDLMTNQGGPPVANIAYSPRPMHNEDVPTRRVESGQDAVDDDDDDEGISGDRGYVMKFPNVSQLPVPTLDGFRGQVIQLNPRLDLSLVERFANEQLRRYKALVETKSNHSRAVSEGQCMTGKYCFSQGGDAKLLPPKTGAQDVDGALTQFQVPGEDEAGGDPESLGDGAVTTAQFPVGVPLPPVNRLPAEFECPLCFKVRKFQKPSDWTKHVHEDLQPFTCTFPDCNEPKSFKRKADWVRHENERHRKLEWWTCTIPECHHTCYRKDNFVQHLVREHKFPEPKVKQIKAKGKNSGANSNSVAPDTLEESRREQEIERLWKLVESCRHDTDRTPRDEPCRFCGNICGNWKKLTVHLAKHMEQIAMVVLALVRERDFSPNANTGPVGNIPIPGSAPESCQTSYLAPYQDETANGSAMQLNAMQGQYTGPAASAAPFESPYTPMIAVQNGILSAEPEPMEECNDVPHYPQLEIPGPGNQQFMPMHQNSVTYPPPFNAVPRARGQNQEMGLLQGPYQLSLSPSEMGPVYDRQGQMYLSPTAENNYIAQTPAMQSMLYDPSGAGYPQNHGANYM